MQVLALTLVENGPAQCAFELEATLLQDLLRALIPNDGGGLDAVHGLGGKQEGDE